jgi:hypothetical protein
MPAGRMSAARSQAKRRPLYSHPEGCGRHPRDLSARRWVCFGSVHGPPALPAAWTTHSLRADDPDASDAGGASVGSMQEIPPAIAPTSNPGEPGGAALARFMTHSDNQEVVGSGSLATWGEQLPGEQ